MTASVVVGSRGVITFNNMIIQVRASLQEACVVLVCLIWAVCAHMQGRGDLQQHDHPGMLWCKSIRLLGCVLCAHITHMCIVLHTHAHTRHTPQGSKSQNSSFWPSNLPLLLSAFRVVDSGAIWQRNTTVCVRLRVCCAYSACVCVVVGACGCYQARN